MHKNPRKILQFIIGLAICFLLIWVLVALQVESPSSRNVRVEPNGRLDSLKVSLNGKQESAAAAKRWQTGPSSIPASSNGIIFPGLLLMLLTVLGLWWWAQKKTGLKDGQGRSSNSLFKEIASQPLAMGQKLLLVEMNEKYWLLAVSENQTSLLHHCKKDEWNDSFEDLEKQSNGRRQSFFDVWKGQRQKYGFGNN